MTYYAVDLSLPELERTFSEVPIEGYKHVTCYGLHGTYDDAREWLKQPDIRAKPKTILWLGSSLGNDNRSSLPPFFSSFREAIEPGDIMLVGIDSCKEPERVYHAYNDREGVTHQFILNGLKHANRLLGYDAFKGGEWEVIGEYDVTAGRHHAFVSPLIDVVVDEVRIPKGERIRIEESYKFSKEEIVELWERSGLVANTVWANSRGDYGLHMVSKPQFFFPGRPEKFASRPIVSLSEWEQLWGAWDSVTRGMIPQQELLSKPIKLRNALIFYLGHIPTFLDIHIAKATDGKPTEPAHFWQIFERGIDPDVDNPEKCHAHSEVPDEWPALAEILKYQSNVRGNVQRLYTSGAVRKSPKAAKAMWIGFEHEAMHLETLLYMLIQSERVLPPPGTAAPDFQALAELSKKRAIENKWFTIPDQSIVLGLDDPDDPSGPERFFGWDLEKPARTVSVPSFQARARPITNGEYAEYLRETGHTKLPASWCDTPYANYSVQAGRRKRDSVMNGSNGFIEDSNGVNGSAKEKYVRTVYGSIPLKWARDWPVVASYDELAGCAQWMGGRIPTLEETRSIYTYVDRTKSEDLEKAIGKTIPAVNGHLVNNGVQESPPSGPTRQGHDNLFINLEQANVGFRHWHPVAVTEKGGELSGQSEMGGVWEWTSTVLEKHQGYEPMTLYPGYSGKPTFAPHKIQVTDIFS